MIDYKYIEKFSKDFQGECLTKKSALYKEACGLYNAMITKEPCLFLRCYSELGVTQAVNFARDNADCVSIKGGGHNLSGVALNEGGITIDVSQLRKVSCDAKSAQLKAQGGCRLLDVDAASSKLGMSVPLGTVSDTGVGGLALGGGIGWLLPSFGLTCDNIEQIKLINWNGESVIVDSKCNADLYWALCGGGGGNYGVVTEFTFKMYPVNVVYAGSLIFKLSDLKSVISILKEINNSDRKSICGMVTAMLDQKHGDCVSLDLCCLDIDKDKVLLSKLISLHAEPIESLMSLMPFVDFQKFYDKCAKKGFRRYAKSSFVEIITDDFSSFIEEQFRTRPSKDTTIFIEEFHGRFASSQFSSSSFANRTAKFNIHLQGCWASKGDDEINMNWLSVTSKGVKTILKESGSYLNYNSDIDSSKDLIFGRNVIERLNIVKQKYDPCSFFRGTISSKYKV